MKKNITKILCLVFALCMILTAMAGCGKGKDKNKDKETDGGKDKAPSSQVEVSANQPSDMTPEWEAFNPYETVTDAMKSKPIRFATWIDHTKTEGAAPLANFEKDTGLKVELFTVPQWNYVSNMMTKMAAGDIPDVFISNEPDDFPRTLQIAAPINKVSTVNLEEPIWHKSMLESATINGNVYLVNTIGSPWSGSNLCFYNKRLFEENGFKTPEQYYKDGTWTWDNMLKCLKDIKALGTEYEGAYADINIVADSFGSSLVKYDYKTGKFSSGCNDKTLVEAYQWYANAKEQGLLNGDLGSFVAGRTGIVLRGTYGFKTTGYFMDMNPEDVGYTYLPSIEEGEKGKISSIYRMYGIVENAPNADAAGYFIRYWLDPKNYDLGNTFITGEAGNFYYELTNSDAEDKYFNFDVPVMSLIGEDAKKIYAGLNTTSAAQVKTKLDSYSNTVQNSVDKANELIQNKIKADAAKYK